MKLTNSQMLTVALLIAGPALSAQQTSLISDSGGVGGDRASNRPDISSLGDVVCWESQSTNFITGDTNFVQDVFVKDMATGVVSRVSVGAFGVQANGESKRPTISGDGNKISFTSIASNLGGIDLNITYDIFVHDRALGTTTLVSQGISGVAGNGLSTRPAMSNDGSSVAYRSLASDLVVGDTNLIDDIFVYDIVSGLNERVSVSTLGVEGNATSDRPTISADGNIVAFWSDANNLVAGDVNIQRDIFVRNRALGTTELISVSTAGVQGNGPSSRPNLSDDGNLVVFTSDASNLILGDTNLVGDVFLRDLAAGTTELISVGLGGAPANGLSSVPVISGDGRYISYRSDANNIVDGDTNNLRDVFLYDRTTGITTILSRSNSGAQGNGSASRPAIDNDGSHVLFQSFATNMVAGDNNLEEDCFLHTGGGWTGPPLKDSIVLLGPSSSTIGLPVALTFHGAPALRPYWVVYSFSNAGQMVAGHGFDVGAPANILSTGTTSALGAGAYTTPPAPAAVSGKVVYMEVAAMEASGALCDSNILGITFM